MTPEEIIEKLEKILPKTSAETISYDQYCAVKEHLISTIISVLKEQEWAVEMIKGKYLWAGDYPEGTIQKGAYDEALTDYQLSLQKKIEEWEKLL